MDVRTTFARLACAAVLALAAPVLHATPVISIYISPSPVPLGGTTTLNITLYDDAGAAFT